MLRFSNSSKENIIQIYHLPFRNLFGIRDLITRSIYNNHQFNNQKMNSLLNFNVFGNFKTTTSPFLFKAMDVEEARFRSHLKNIRKIV